MVNDDYMNSVILTIDVNVPKIVDLLTEIRDLLRAECANPTPEPTAEE